MRPERALPAIVLAALLLLPGCLEEEVTTTIHPDGSCERMVVVKADGPDFPRMSFPIILDASWDTTRVKAGESQSGYRWTLKKQFPSYDSLSREYVRASVPGKIHIAVDVQKRFRWFYTYFEYKETYSRYSRYNLISPSAVMSEDEILRYTYGDTSAALKKKIEEWEGKNLVEVLLTPLVRTAEQLHDSALLVRLSAHKEEFLRQLSVVMDQQHRPDSLRARPLFNTPGPGASSDSLLTEAGMDTLVELAAQVFESESLKGMKDVIRQGWGEAEKLMLDKDAGRGETFTNSVVMPGKLLETGAPAVEGNTASWKFEKKQLALHDYEMHAESRVVNIWAMVVTGLLVLGLLSFALALPAMLRRRHPLLTPSMPSRA